jgi:hypothetical protein
MNSSYANENLRGVSWLNARQRAQYEVTIRNGLLYDARGRPIDTSRAVSAHSGNGTAIFVLGTDGRVYLSPTHQPGRFHHSSFLAGGDVAAAGELVVSNGRIVGISDRSGHYTPDPLMMRQLMIHLRRNGVSLQGVNYLSSHARFRPIHAYDLLAPNGPGVFLGGVPP